MWMHVFPLASYVTFLGVLTCSQYCLFTHSLTMVDIFMWVKFYTLLTFLQSRIKANKGRKPRFCLVTSYLLPCWSRLLYMAMVCDLYRYSDCASKPKRKHRGFPNSRATFTCSWSLFVFWWICLWICLFCAYRTHIVYQYLIFDERCVNLDANLCPSRQPQIDLSAFCVKLKGYQNQ